jgi:hypothetical protein
MHIEVEEVVFSWDSLQVKAICKLEETFEYVRRGRHSNRFARQRAQREWRLLSCRRRTVLSLFVEFAAERCFLYYD